MSPEGTPLVEDLVYRSCGGTEHFVSVVAGDALIGYTRLRFPGSPGREVP
jgi:elongator complex protein 3